MVGSELARQFDELDATRPGLVVLAACRSARLEDSGQSITSVARRLHHSGLERVLGMRLSIMDAAAAAFTAELFQRLVRGVWLGRAVTLARRQTAEGGWLTSNMDFQSVQRELRPNADAAPSADPFAQWTLPVCWPDSRRRRTSW